MHLDVGFPDSMFQRPSATTARRQWSTATCHYAQAIRHGELEARYIWAAGVKNVGSSLTTGSCQATLCLLLVLICFVLEGHFS